MSDKDTVWEVSWRVSDDGWEHGAVVWVKCGQVLCGRSFTSPQPSCRGCGCSLCGRGLSWWLADTDLQPLLQAPLSPISRFLSFILYFCGFVFLSLMFRFCTDFMWVGPESIHLVLPRIPSAGQIPWHNEHLRAVWSSPSALVVKMVINS